MNERISVVIISYNCKEYVEDCIKSIILTCYENIPEIIVVDNNSTDYTVEYISKLYPEVKMKPNSKNLGYSAAINIGAALSTGDYIVLSNADVIYKNGCIYGLVEKLKTNLQTGMVGPQQLYFDGSFQRSFGYFPSIKRALLDITGLSKFILLQKKRQFFSGNFNSYNVEYLDGAVLCVSKALFEKLNGFDEGFFFYSEEVEFCYRINQLGLTCTLVPENKVVHHRGGSQQDSGMNKKSIDMLVNSESIFLSKHSNSFNKITYFLIEKLFFILLRVYNSILGKKNKAKNNTKYINAINKVLNEK